MTDIFCVSYETENEFMCTIFRYITPHCLQNIIFLSYHHFPIDPLAYLKYDFQPVCCIQIFLWFALFNVCPQYGNKKSYLHDLGTADISLDFHAALYSTCPAVQYRCGILCFSVPIFVGGNITKVERGAFNVY